MTFIQYPYDKMHDEGKDLKPCTVKVVSSDLIIKIRNNRPVSLEEEIQTDDPYKQRRWYANGSCIFYYDGPAMIFAVDHRSKYRRRNYLRVEGPISGEKILAIEWYDPETGVTFERIEVDQINVWSKFAPDRREQLKALVAYSLGMNV